jgi:hypothetical protein
LKYNFFNILYRKKDKEIFKNLYYQLLIGHGFYGAFWFLFNLIFHSLLFTIIILLFHKKHSYIIQILFILVSIYNYLGYNISIFSNYKHEVEHSIKPIMITLLYSINGFFLGSINAIEKLYKYRIIVIIYLTFTIYAIIKDKKTIIIYFYKYYIFIINFVSTSIFLIFACFPFDKIKNIIIIDFIKQITRYTGGVYYLHSDINNVFKKNNFKILKVRGVKESIIIYVFCYFVCLTGSFLCRNINLKYLFI